MALEVWLVRPPLKDDPSKHAWTCPKYMPVILKGACTCGGARALPSRETLAPEEGNHG